MAAINGKIPFDANGNMCEYQNDWSITEWKDNYEFETEMRIESISRGRSSATFILYDTEQRRYSMFMTDMLTLLKSGKVEKGTVSGRWTFQKRGQNFGVRLV